MGKLSALYAKKEVQDVLDLIYPISLLEWDDDDFIAWASPYLRNGWRLVAADNHYMDDHRLTDIIPHFYHNALLFRIGDAGTPEYRSLSDFGNDPLPSLRTHLLKTGDRREMYFSGKIFEYYSVVFPGVKPTKSEQEFYDVNPDGSEREEWEHDCIDEAYAAKILGKVAV